MAEPLRRIALKWLKADLFTSKLASDLRREALALHAVLKKAGEDVILWADVLDVPPRRQKCK